MRNALSRFLACAVRPLLGGCAFSLFMLACSDDSATEKIVEVAGDGMEVVSDVSLLPDCSEKNDGEMVWVKNETTPRMCSDGKWYAIAEGSVAATCSTEPLKDGTGVKIVCGGDSIGVVYNGVDGKAGEQGLPGEKGDNGKRGADGVSASNGTPGLDGTPGVDGKDGRDGDPGADGKDGEDGIDGKNGVGCSMKSIDEYKVLVICGDDSAEFSVRGIPDTVASGSVVLDSEKIAISLDQVSGVTQKGPFLRGSRVLVREMEDGRTLTQTGNSFNGKILNDKGEFRINARMLVSQYVMLEATGYYRNEVTGENSNSELTLFAITDVNDRSVVNVNLLTHLEYERVIYLVTQKKMKVKVAKKQAQQEVFGILHIDATGFSNSEDLSVVGSSEEDAALLAFSIVLQGDRSESQLSELLTNVAMDMEKDGSLDSSALRQSLVDWAVSVDSNGRVEKFRENVANWGVSHMVPNFEKYIYGFWTKELKLDSCNEANWGKVVASKKGPASRRYVCREDGLWHLASDLEKDTYDWKDTVDGALKTGPLSGKTFIFDSLGMLGGVRGWRELTYKETLYGGCTKAHYGEIQPNNKVGEYYQCQEGAHDWVLFKYNLHIDTTLWTKGEDGYSELVDGRCIVYDTSRAFTHYMRKYGSSDKPLSGESEYGYWRLGFQTDCALGLFGCTEGRVGKVGLAKDGDYYECHGFLSCDGFSILDSCSMEYNWSKIGNFSQYSLASEANVHGWDCLDSNNGEMRLGLVNDAYYVCEDNHWREASIEEEMDCRENGNCWLNLNYCTWKIDGTFAECDSGVCVCAPKSYNSDGSGYDYDWRKANCAEIATGGLCTTTNDSSIVWGCENLGSFKIDYVCLKNRWETVVSPFDYTVENWKKKRAEYYTQEAHPGVEYGDDLVDARDNQVYKTVYIGGRRWMAENLRYADSVATINLKGQTQCERGLRYVGSGDYADFDKIGTCEIGARRYSWTAAMDVDFKWQYANVVPMISLPHRGICPEGWHIPDTTEWQGLLESVDNIAALQMRGFSTMENATDASGFSAFYTGFWSSIENADDGRVSHGFAVGSDDGKMESRKKYMYSVRCVENDKE